MAELEYLPMEREIYDPPLQNVTPLLNILTLGGLALRGPLSLLFKKAAGTKLSRGETLKPISELKTSGFAGLKYTPLNRSAIRAGREASRTAKKLNPEDYNPAVVKTIWTKDPNKFLSPHPNIKVMPKGTKVPIDILKSIGNYRKLGVPTSELPKYLTNIYKKGTFKTIWK